MASDVRVHVTDQAIISALNTPGRAVFAWRDGTAVAIVTAATAASPVNNPINALHRGGRVGEFKAGWDSSRTGSNQHRVRARIFNHAAHGIYVELGRSASTKEQEFSWVNFEGKIRFVGGPKAKGRAAPGTRARPGRHILRNATNAVMPTRCGGYTPLA